MNQEGDDLEIYLAAGIDVPTAIVLSDSPDERAEPPIEPTKATSVGCLTVLALALAFALAVAGLHWLGWLG